MITIDVSRGVKSIGRDLDAFARRQAPFATALALTRTAKLVAAAEVEELDDTFDKPTPFTKRAFGTRSANKVTLVAKVFAKDIQAEYLEPFLDGGLQVLKGKRAILTPKGVRKNAYGNIPKGKLALLKAQSDVFVGPVKLSGQVINGVWQRGSRDRRRGKGKRSGGYGTKGSNTHGRAQGVKARTTLKLLIRFDDPKPVSQRLPYEARARAVVDRHLKIELDAALAEALATAR